MLSGDGYDNSGSLVANPRHAAISISSMDHQDASASQHSSSAAVAANLSAKDLGSREFGKEISIQVLPDIDPDTDDEGDGQEESKEMRLSK